MLNNQSSRWYDKDPTVSLSISFLRNANHEVQVDAANFVLKKFKELGIEYSDKRKPFRFFKRRWYDSHESLYNAIETLREAPGNVQKEIAVELIDFLCVSDASMGKDLA